MSINKIEKWDDVSQERVGNPTAEEASRTCDGERMQGETFRQKDWETYHILNLVLYGKAYFLKHIIRAKDRKDDIYTRCV